MSCSGCPRLPHTERQRYVLRGKKMWMQIPCRAWSSNDLICLGFSSSIYLSSQLTIPNWLPIPTYINIYLYIYVNHNQQLATCIATIQQFAKIFTSHSDVFLALAGQCRLRGDGSHHTARQEIGGSKEMRSVKRAE